MADKGFQLKVIIPTDDGFNISTNGVEKASYYLMYNISNRSYQLAGKIKTAGLYENSEFDLTVLKSEIEKANVDKIICNKQFGILLEHEVLFVKEKEIRIVLNNLIDLVDKKEAVQKVTISNEVKESLNSNGLIIKRLLLRSSS